MANRRRDPRIKEERKADGRVRYRVTVSITINGKPVQKKRRFDTVRDAEQFIKETEAAATTGTLSTGKPTTLDDLCEEWLEAHGPLVRLGTLAGYRSALRLFRDVLGRRPVASLTAADVEQVRNRLVDAGRTTRTVSYNLGVIRQVLDRAVADRRMTHNPARLVRATGKSSAHTQAYTLAETRAIRTAVKGHRWEHAFVLMLTGLRRSEVMALQWSDVNLEVGQVSVTKSRTVAKGEGQESTVVGNTKTSNGERTISLGDDEVAVLAAARLRMGMSEGPLVVDAWGRPAYPDALGDAWREVCKEHGIRYLDTRALRRTSVTLMRDAGVPDHVVAKHHGHDEVIMRRAYTRPDSEQLEAAALTMRRLRSTG